MKLLIPSLLFAVSVSGQIPDTNSIRYYVRAVKYDTIPCWLLVSDTSVRAGLINPVVKQIRGYYAWKYNEWETGLSTYLDANKKPLPKWMAVWMKL